MIIKKPADIKSDEITPESVYIDRRKFIGTSAIGLTAAALGSRGSKLLAQDDRQDDELTSFESITTHNNFYEFGTGKGDPSRNAHTLRPRPWTVTVEGAVENPGEYDLDDLLRPHTVQERIYRMRCVEAWSMVIPWQGVPLGDVIARLGPTANANYVEFVTLLDPIQMPGQRRRVIDWPYIEGLRMDEATHPLTILATGLYDRDLLNQNGAPLRLVIPWKYGFKGIKSIVAIRFVERQPINSWKALAPNEYGFFANVNPEVNHPRWSQARERRIGKFRKIRTLPFNGYGDEVAHMYAGMDPRTLY